MKKLALVLVEICDALGRLSMYAEKLADKVYLNSKEKNDVFCNFAEHLGTLSIEIENLADRCFYIACDIDNASKD